MLPCEQADKIEHIHESLDRMESGVQKVIDLLVQVASQNERLNHLEDFMDHQYTDNTKIYDRLRKVENESIASIPTITNLLEKSLCPLEKKVDRHNRIIYMITHKYSFTAYGAILTIIAFGLILDFWNHYDNIRTMLKFISSGGIIE